MKRGFILNFGLVVCSIVICLIVIELLLRFAGKAPGYISRYHVGYKHVEQLEVDRFFYTDDEGVFKADPKHPWPQECSINSDGFRSIEFKHYETEKTKILFLGDSYTWGGEAQPLTNSFVDIVTRNDFLTFNTGIPCGHPNQYAYLAEKYVPTLKPDIVATMFFRGNDILEAQPMLPNKNLFHITNAGWLYAFDHKGNYMSPQQTYDYYLPKTNLAFIEETEGLFHRVMRSVFLKSVVGSYCWAGLSAAKEKTRNIYRYVRTVKSVAKDHHTIQDPRRKKALSNVRECFSRIKRVSEQHGARCMFFLIPPHPELRDKNNSIEYNKYNFRGFSFYHPSPDSFTDQDYVDPPDGHFNNSGHKKYAEFIITTVRSIK